MKKPIVVFFVFLISGFSSFAQVGIGTTTPNASAKLQVDATDKGFLPPRVSLLATNDVATIPSPATGLLIYNTATAGTSPNNVTPGFYFYDGSKWQRLISQQPDATVNFDKTTPTTTGVTFTPNTPASQDYVYVSSVDNSQWTYNGSNYVTYTPPPSTAWYAQSSTNDAGSNKTSGIYRNGNVGIGDFATSSPATKLEVKSGVTNTSGLRMTNLTSASPTSGGATLGVDASGNVITVNGSSFSPEFGFASPTGTVSVSSGSTALLCSVTLPSNGTYLINYTMRVQLQAPGSDTYGVGYLCTSNSDASAIAGTEILGAYYYSATTSAMIGGNYSGSHIITITNAPRTIYFRGKSSNGTSILLMMQMVVPKFPL
ncbi:hypothetical protein EMGBS15_03560 [Filimonas sp.]|nr:hypothetical protein EMGBS15_03560 [Filimonas sp.]